MSHSILTSSIALAILGIAKAGADSGMASSESDRHFIERLADEKLTAEQRSMRIEKWRESVDSARLNHSTQSKLESPSAASTHVAAQISPLVVPKVAIPKDPLLADIHVTEGEISSILRSIQSKHFNPEQRAIQIDQFLEMNRDAFAQLQQLKQQAGAHAKTENRSSPASTTVPVPMSVDASHLKAEIDRVMHDLSLISPEARAQYLETHASALRAMSEQLSKSLSLSKSTPTNQNTPAAP